MNNFNLNKKFYDIFDVLTDMAYVISNSGYAKELVFRGGFTLISAMSEKMEVGFQRLTTDLDIDWKTCEQWEQFIRDLPEFLTSGSKYGFKYSLLTRKDFDSGESIKLQLQCNVAQNVMYEVGIDMSVRETLDVTTFQVPGTGFSITAGGVYEMLCDKLSVFSSEKIGRRVKDLYDIYIISHMSGIRKDKIVDLWDDIGYEIKGTIFGLSPANFSRIKKPWDKLKFARFSDLEFEVVIGRVTDFTAELYVELAGGSSSGEEWNEKAGVWR